MDVWLLQHCLVSGLFPPRNCCLPLSEICWAYFELLFLCSLSCLLDVVSISLQIHHTRWQYDKLCGYISLKIAIWILSPYSFFPKNYFSYFSSSVFPCKFWNNLVYVYKTLCWNVGSNPIKPGKVLTYLLCWVIQSMNTVCFWIYLCVFLFWTYKLYTCFVEITSKYLFSFEVWILFSILIDTCPLLYKEIQPIFMCLSCTLWPCTSHLSALRGFVGLWDFLIRHLWHL